MKKFLLKGKQLLSKKLQQFDIEPVQIDYVTEQTPSRLKQSLNVLKQNQIDLEDNHVYQTYFKNYPNHHISHYLLDKFKAYQKAVANTDSKQQQSKNLIKNQEYITPPNPNSFIPNFDVELESKALAFKAAIQQYDEGYNKNQEPLLRIYVIHFHHKRGTQIEYMYPQNKKIDAISDQIVHHAMPDSSHLRNQDCNFFNFQSDCLGKKRMLFGVSYFKQIKVTQQMKKNNNQLTRSHLQKAIAIVSTVPLFQYLKIRLQNTTQIFFENFTNYQVIQQVYKNINFNLLQTWENIKLQDLYMGCDLKKIISCLGVNNLYDIWKAMLYQRRIVVFAQTSSDASSFILSLLSLFPGLSTFGIASKPISRYLQSLRQYALPLRMFNSKNFLSISFHVQDFWQLANFIKNDEGNFLIGTTNKLLKQANEYGIQMLINLQDGTITKNKSKRPWEQLTKKQKTFISDVKQTFENLQNSNNLNSQDIIRNLFHDFLKGVLLQMMVGMRDYQVFMNQCVKYQKMVKKSQVIQSVKDKNYKLMEDQQQSAQSGNGQISLGYAPTFPQSTNQIILPQLLLNKSFAYFRQFHNSNLPEIINGRIIPSIYVNNYDYYFRVSQDQFISYNWFQKRLRFGKGSSQNFDGKQMRYKCNSNIQIIKQQGKELAKSIYIGQIVNGKYFKHGFYVDKSQYYEGEFNNGLKHGYGKFTNSSQKYIGNFVNNLYQGEGQLIRGAQVYAGSFKQGLKHGFGSTQGSESFSGEWRFDRPLKQDQYSQIQVKQKSEGRKSSASESRKK